jgi:hypothetical protein
MSWSVVPLCDKCKKYLQEKANQRKVRHFQEKEEPDGPKTID